MQTNLIDGIEIRSDDTDILEAIAKDEDIGNRGNTMVVGIRNSAGKIYRLIHTVGLSEFMDTIARLEGCNLKDELADVDDMHEGCDAIFS